MGQSLTDGGKRDEELNNCEKCLPLNVYSYEYLFTEDKPLPYILFTYLYGLWINRREGPRLARLEEEGRKVQRQLIILAD